MKSAILEKIKKMKAGHSAGFVLLFAILVASIVSAAGLGISRILLKQIILTSMQRDSQVAFFAADTGLECARYAFEIGVADWPQAEDQPVFIKCNGKDIPMTYNSLKGGYFSADSIEVPKPLKLAWNENDMEVENESCVNLEIYPDIKIIARGNNTCGESVRQVERARCFEYMGVEPQFGCLAR